MAWNTPFDGSVFEPEYTEEDRILDLSYQEEEKINDHLAEDEHLEQMLQENYSEILHEDDEIENLIRREPK